MSRTMKVGVAALAAVIVLSAAFWYFVLRDDSPPPVSLDSALDTITQTPSATATMGAGDPTAGAANPTATTEAEPSAGIDGEWAVDTSQETFVGYRVEEELAQIGATTAVGRTPNVTGGITIADGVVAAGAVIEADMTTLQSDSGLRDGQLRNQGIQFGQFPTATFTLTEAVELPAGLEEGERVSTTLVGEFELHGVTQPVEIPVEAQLSNGLIVVVGSITIAFADYDIEAPNAARVLSIADNGVMEFQLFFSKG